VVVVTAVAVVAGAVALAEHCDQGYLALASARAPGWTGTACESVQRELLLRFDSNSNRYILLQLA